MSGTKLDSSRVVLGVVGTHHGVKGGLKIHSHTRPAEQIFDYSVWQVGRGRGLQLENSRGTHFQAIRQTSDRALAGLSGPGSRHAVDRLSDCG